MEIVSEKTERDSLLGNLDEALRSAYNGVAEAIPDEKAVSDIRYAEVYIKLENCVSIPEVQIEINRLPERIHIFRKEEENERTRNKD